MDFKTNLIKASVYGFVFLIGFLSCMLVVAIGQKAEMPLAFGYWENGLEAPGNWISEQEIQIYDNAVVLNIEGASLSRYAPTGSMKPLLNENSNGIKIVPKSEQDISIGDIVTFEQNGEHIIHRVIEKGIDEKGVYFITKGDNNNVSDGKIRFSQIKYVTIGMLW